MMPATSYFSHYTTLAVNEVMIILHNCYLIIPYFSCTVLLYLLCLKFSRDILCHICFIWTVFTKKFKC